MKHIAILNGGSRTRKTFSAAVPSDTTFHFFRTKDSLLHITEDREIHFIHGNQPTDFNFHMIFTRLRSRDQHFCGIILEHAQSLGTIVNDPINVSFCHADEKISQMTRLARNGINIPTTFILQENSYAKNATYLEQHIQYPCVFKTDGSQGRNVHIAENKEALELLLRDKAPYKLCLIQNIIPNTFDTRTLVFRERILGSISRTAPAGTFHNNVAKGAAVAPYQLTTVETEVAIKACAVCHIDFGGVDIIHTDNGPIVLEVNKSPQIAGFETIHGEGYVFTKIAEIMSIDSNC
jgi:ribosomal protein S6--L-glutamate ligase